MISRRRFCEKPAMADLAFDRLLAIYRASVFEPAVEKVVLAIETAEILSDLKLVYADESVARSSGLEPLSDPATLSVGDHIELAIKAPRLSIGRLARDLDGLLAGPQARIREPRAYFLIEGAVSHESDPAPDEIRRYHLVLRLAALFQRAASYVNETMQEFVYLSGEQFVVPVRYDRATLRLLSCGNAGRLLEQFVDDLHIDQKLAILAETICRLIAAQPSGGRFAYLLDNLDELEKQVRNGYKLFASSFSYSKIRSEIEATHIDYVAKIHKTLIDIQGQLLGIPVATVIVASQLKTAKTCGLEFWANIAVVCGAWIFVGLLGIAILNQWGTLGSIAEEIAGQKKKLKVDYAAISDQFMDLFSKLDGRIWWRRAALIAIAVVAIAGAAGATYVFFRITHVQAGSCLHASWL